MPVTYQAALVDVGDDGGDEAAGSGHRHAHVHGGVQFAGSGCRVKGCVHFGHVPEREASAPNDQVVDRHLQSR